MLRFSILIAVTTICAGLSACARGLAMRPPPWSSGMYGFDGTFTVRQDSLDAEHVDSISVWGQAVVEENGPTRAETSLGPCELHGAPFPNRSGQAFRCGGFALELVPESDGVSGRISGEFLETVRVLRCAETASVNDRMTCVRQDAVLVDRSRRLSADLKFVRLR